MASYMDLVGQGFEPVALYVRVLYLHPLASARLLSKIDLAFVMLLLLTLLLLTT